MNIGDKILLTTERWFNAPDGQMYNGVFGTLNNILGDDVLGIKTNRNSTNWFVSIGLKYEVLIAGCQIHYAVKCDSVSKTPPTRDVEFEGKLRSQQESVTRIFIAD